MQRLGLTIGFEGTGLRDAVELARHAEELGYTDLWTAEVGGADALTPLAALAVTTSSARLGTGIVPVFTRPPALLAMSAAALGDLSGGRFVLGLGTSSNVIVERWMGERFARPLTRLREYVEVVRACLTGDKVEFHGLTTRVDGFRLQHAPADVPIHVAALGPAACALAGEVGDGIVFFLKTPDGVREGLSWANAQRRDRGPLDVVIRLPFLVDHEPEVLSVAARRLLLSYAPVDVYARSLAAQGFGVEIAAIREAWNAGDRRRAVELVPDHMIDALFVTGVDRAAARLDELRAAGVTTPVLLPMSFADPAERAGRVRRAVEALAPERARLGGTAER
ncbi:MAG TPA: LLM class F420-dependent oxidoreductase [Actinomycetota bacterium]|nr:LLM class F420-dependent oxidoreductase [Actinomycetota bacterium]